MKYAYLVYKMKVEEHIFWVAESKDLKGCVGQGETSENAVKELENNEIEWLESAVKYGINIPENTIETVVEYSGKFTVRISTSVHEDAAQQAKKQGVSLNQYVNDAIVVRNSRYSTLDDISKPLKKMLTDFQDNMEKAKFTHMVCVVDKIYNTDVKYNTAQNTPYVFNLKQ